MALPEDLRIADQAISVRAMNALFDAGIRTLGDLAKRTTLDMVSIRNFGDVSFREAEVVLAKHGLAFAGEERPVAERQEYPGGVVICQKCGCDHFYHRMAFI